MGRRGNGEGSFRKLSNGTWELSRMVGYHPDGRRRIKSVYGSTKASCQQQMRAYLHDIESGLNVDNQYTFSEWADVVMKHHSPNIKVVTQESYRYTLKILNTYFANRKINSLKPIHIEEFLLQLREEGRSDSTIAQCRGLLYMVLERAEGNDLIRRNPVRFAEKMRKRAPIEKEIYTVEEIDLLMRNLPQNRIGWSIRLLLTTGIRGQELLALQPTHISEDGSYLDVRQAITMVKGTAIVSTTKSFDSNRRVYIPEKVRYCAIALRNTEAKYIWSVGHDDVPCNPSTFRKYYRQAIEAVPGVRYLSVHNCRHTYVSMMQALGVDMATIQSLVGHSTVLMTQRYLHVHPSVQAAAVEKYSEIIPVHNED